MDIQDLQTHWDRFGKSDPLWAISTLQGKRDGAWSPAEFFATGRDEIARLLTDLEALGLGMPHGRAMDFGCGVGRLSQALAARFDAVDGVDIAPSMLDLARQYNQHGERCRYHLNAQDNLAACFGDGSFDFVYSKSVLQHMEPRYAAGYIREFVRVLKPGSGTAVFQQHSRPLAVTDRARALARSVLPAGTLALYRSARAALRRAPVMELYGMTPAEVTACVEAAGGRVRHCETDPSGSGSWETYRYIVQR